MAMPERHRQQPLASRCGSQVSDEERIAAAKVRYLAAIQALFTAIAADPQSKDLLPAALRVGVNVSLSDHGALAMLLIAKGICSRAEYAEAIADAMEAEAENAAES